MGIASRISALPAKWWKARNLLRRTVEHAAWDLSERYGGAAQAIARNSARQPVGAGRRKFWKAVAVKLSGMG